MTLNQSTTVLIAFIFVLALQACSSTGGSPSNVQSSEKTSRIFNHSKADQDYQELVLALKNGNATNKIFDSIVRVYPITSNYDPYDGIEQAQKLYANNAMDAGEWLKCLRATNAILNHNFTSLTGHYGAMVCQLEGGNEIQGKFHRTMLDGFISAILRSGNGLTPESAFYITTSNDLYAFIQLQNHIATGQSLIYKDEKPIHSMTVINQKNKKESIWYFDMTAQFRRGLFD